MPVIVLVIMPVMMLVIMPVIVLVMEIVNDSSSLSRVNRHMGS
jgi:hypothetical protein